MSVVLLFFFFNFITNLHFIIIIIIIISSSSSIVLFLFYFCLFVGIQMEGSFPNFGLIYDIYDYIIKGPAQPCTWVLFAAVI